MVRINLIDPACLVDQHLIAEYNEILMLLGYVKKHPKAEDIPKTYRLGKGHIKFFKDKLLYLKDRHMDLADEMKKRGFSANVSVDLSEFPDSLKNSWAPSEEDFLTVRSRIASKLVQKKDYYRYYGEKKDADFLTALLEDNK